MCGKIAPVFAPCTKTDSFKGTKIAASPLFSLGLGTKQTRLGLVKMLNVCLKNCRLNITRCRTRTSELPQPPSDRRSQD